MKYSNTSVPFLGNLMKDFFPAQVNSKPCLEYCRGKYHYNGPYSETIPKSFSHKSIWKLSFYLLKGKEPFWFPERYRETTQKVFIDSVEREAFRSMGWNSYSIISNWCRNIFNCEGKKAFSMRLVSWNLCMCKRNLIVYLCLKLVSLLYYQSVSWWCCSFGVSDAYHLNEKAFNF